MITPESYFSERGLWDFDTLQKECERSLVRIAHSSITPTTVMLHYANEAQFNKSWNNFNRMCRGLIVDLKNRKILAYPLEKFFNIDEMPETKYIVLEKLGAFETTEKLDGSLCILYKEPTTGEYRLTTKGSFDSDHGAYATSIIPDSLKDSLFVEDYTLMFELISSKFPIVINYKLKGYPEGLYLVGVRNRKSNELLSYTEVHRLAKDLGVYSPKTYKFSSLDELIENVKRLSVLEEGFVLRFKNDLLVKVKGNKYLAAHRFISKLSPKYILEALGNGTTDDLLQVAPEEYRQDVEDTISSFMSDGDVIAEDCREYFAKAPKTTRKEFAMWVQQEVPDYYRKFLFTLMDGKQLDLKKVYDLVGDRNGVSGETRI